MGTGSFHCHLLKRFNILPGWLGHEGLVPRVISQGPIQHHPGVLGFATTGSRHSPACSCQN